jgi:hypothetical protein
MPSCNADVDNSKYINTSFLVTAEAVILCV